MVIGKLYYEINAFIDKVDGTKLLTLSNSDIYTDKEVDISELDCDFQPYRGDEVRLRITKIDMRVSCIEPCEKLRVETGKITYLTRSFGVVDKEVIFFQMDDWKPKIDDEVEYTIIDGDYNVGKSQYKMRCESIKKRIINDPSIYFEEGALAAQRDLMTVQLQNVDSDDDDNGSEMRFEAFKKKEPFKEYYDLPYGLYDVLTSKDSRQIKKMLDEFIPKELSYKTYKRRLHALIYLEEIEMKASFEKYKSREIWIEPEKTRFSISCSKITELRPPISVGDKLEVRKCQNPRRYYRGTVERVLENRFVLKFKPDFSKEYIIGEAYSAEFFYSRTVFHRKHAAVDYAKKKLNQSFLFPNEISTKPLQLNAELKDNKLMLNKSEEKWFKADLNEEQKQSVAGALRGQCRPLPYIILGPPVINCVLFFDLFF